MIALQFPVLFIALISGEASTLHHPRFTSQSTPPQKQQAASWNRYTADLHSSGTGQSEPHSCTRCEKRYDYGHRCPSLFLRSCLHKNCFVCDIPRARYTVCERSDVHLHHTTAQYKPACGARGRKTDIHRQTHTCARSMTRRQIFHKVV